MPRSRRNCLFLYLPLLPVKNDFTLQEAQTLEALSEALQPGGLLLTAETSRLLAAHPSNYTQEDFQISGFASFFFLTGSCSATVRSQVLLSAKTEKRGDGCVGSHFLLRVSKRARPSQAV